MIVRKAGLLRLGEDKFPLCHTEIQSIHAFDLAIYKLYFKIMCCCCHFVNTYINPGNRKVIKKKPVFSCNLEIRV